MINRIVLISFFFIITFHSSFSQDCSSFGWKEILDFTVTENGNISLITAAKYNAESKKLEGLYYAYDYNGRLVFDRPYQISTEEYSIQDSIKKHALGPYDLLDAFALDAARNHTIFYGHLHGQTDIIKIILADKRGRNKKSISEKVSWARDIENDLISTRSSLYFWMVAHQNVLRLNQYLTKHDAKYSQVKQFILTDGSKIDSETGLILETKGNSTTASYLLDGKAQWKQELNGQLADNGGIERKFKLIETSEKFYFYLLKQASPDCPKIFVPIVYCLDKKMHGLPTMKVEIERSKA